MPRPIVRPKRPPPLPTFILSGVQPVPEPDLAAWKAWMLQHQDELVIEQTKIPEYGLLIVTRFAGVDVCVQEQPRAFRTEVFGGKGEGMARYYLTRAQARAGHPQIVQICRETFSEEGQKRIAAIKEKRLNNPTPPKPRVYPTRRRSPYSTH